MSFIFVVGSTVDARTHAGLTALHLASECGHTSVVCALLDHHRGPSIYNSKASIDTLESASSNDKSLDVNSWTTVEHFTALHVAAHSGHTDLIEMLLSKYRVRAIRKQPRYTLYYFQRWKARYMTCIMVIMRPESIKAGWPKKPRFFCFFCGESTQKRAFMVLQKESKWVVIYEAKYEILQCY